MGIMRDKSKFASPFTGYLYYAAKHTVDLLDIDGLLSKISKKLFRVIDWKRLNERINKSQERTFPLMNKIIDVAIDKGIVKQGSGIYTVHTNIDETIDPEHKERILEEIKQTVNDSSFPDDEQFERIVKLVEERKIYTQYSLSSGNVIIRAYRDGKPNNGILYTEKQFIDFVEGKL